MSGGQIKRINHQIDLINGQIEENKLLFINPLYFVDDNGNRIRTIQDDEKIEAYDETIEDISEAIGEYRGILLQTSQYTDEKKETYKSKVSELENLREKLKDMRKQKR
ncbi:hypothetical protein [Clostridium aciditolerans]|uniref:Uncharacterized protein n=1 Tax=Clostridium aciditolerans TaxID=339861 RepID=A0A934M7E7_9CLOT|nr:hypothetical protein [Clostridium aciditolerans]MBI6875608.1 hypothetical protein [Clostridium aciditolerans]